MQFRFGNMRAHVYQLGDAVIWGAPQEGERSARHVLVRGDGVCHACRADEVQFDIVVRDGIRESALPSPPSRVFPVEGYIDVGAASSGSPAGSGQ